MHLGFSKLLGKLVVNKINIHLLKVCFKNKIQQMTYLMVFKWWFCVLFFWFSLWNICCGYTFELHRQVDAIQMGTQNMCLYKEVDKTYTGCNLKTMELLDCALTGVCAVIRLNTVPSFYQVVGLILLIWIFTSLKTLFLLIQLNSIFKQAWTRFYTSS